MKKFWCGFAVDAFGALLLFTVAYLFVLGLINNS